MFVTAGNECRELPAARQVSLLETLAAAASQMALSDKMRPGAGPPPLLVLKQALPPAEHLKPHHLNPLAAKSPTDAAPGEHPLSLVHLTVTPTECQTLCSFLHSKRIARQAQQAQLCTCWSKQVFETNPGVC